MLTELYIEALIADGRERGRAERQAFMQSLQEILTPEQWAEIEVAKSRPAMNASSAWVSGSEAAEGPR